MNEGRTVFAQLMGELPKYEFDKCVRRYRGDHRVRSLTAYEGFVPRVVEKQLVGRFITQLSS